MTLLPRINPASARSGHGQGAGAVVLRQSRHRFSGLDLMVSADDISRPTQWSIRESRHTVVVHLGGRMDELATELDGHGGSRGGALPGEVWTIPAGRAYASQARGGTIRYAVLFVEPAAKGGREMIPVAGQRDELLHQGIQRLLASVSSADDVSRMRTESLGQMIGRHLRRSYEAGPMPVETRPPRLSPPAIRLLRDYIHDNLAGPMGLADLAGLAGLSPHHLLIAFRQAFGQTPAQYIIIQRLRAAQRLLTRTRKDITLIALETGFSSHSHLTSTFTNRLGLAPSRFRMYGA
jgi:AraC family transcriptional regulator